MDSERVRPTLASTGDSRVDAAVEGLAALDDLDLDERPAVLALVHDRLREILGELGDGPRAAPGEPGRPGEQDELGAGPQARPALPRPGGPGTPGPGSWMRRPDA